MHQRTHHVRSFPTARKGSLDRHGKVVRTVGNTPTTCGRIVLRTIRISELDPAITAQVELRRARVAVLEFFQLVVFYHRENGDCESIDGTPNVIVTTYCRSIE